MSVKAELRPVAIPRLLAVQTKAVLLGYWRTPCSPSSPSAFR